jgi:hypothetical protein
MLRTLMAGLMAVILLSACSTVKSIKVDYTDKEYPPTKKGDILVFATADAGREYVILAEIVAMADANEDSEPVVRLLRREAAEYGADAIVNLRFEFGYGQWANGLKGYATAVKFVKK